MDIWILPILTLLVSALGLSLMFYQGSRVMREVLLEYQDTRIKLTTLRDSRIELVNQIIQLISSQYPYALDNLHDAAINASSLEFNCYPLIDMALAHYQACKDDGVLITRMHQLEVIEQQMDTVRLAYNQVCMKWNKYVQAFPTNLIAWIKGYTPHQLYMVQGGKVQND